MGYDPFQEQVTGTSSLGYGSFKWHKESEEEREGRVRQRVHVIFKEPFYELLAKIWDKPYYKKPFPIGRDPKKWNQWWKYAYHEEKWHRTENYRVLKSLLDQLVQVGHLKEFVDQENTKVEEAEVRTNPSFNRDRDKANNAL